MVGSVVNCAVHAWVAARQECRLSVASWESGNLDCYGKYWFVFFVKTHRSQMN